ncbi:MAG: hypothetical protein KBS74_02245 [Clostridiales bacterium]|nr:hypothetical protein [Candidatus Cacconaster stercorequi]
MRKMEANIRAAVKQLARTLNANFTHKDLYITLKYDDEHLPEDWKRQEKDRAEFIRRMKSALKRQGIRDTKWVSVCSEVDGKTGEAVRPHIHIPISGDGITFRDGEWWIGNENLTELWGKGSVYAEPMRRQKDYTALAIYLIRQAGRQTDRRKYHTSRNMVKPTVEEFIALTDRKMQAPAGAVTVEKQYNALTGANYLRYIKPEKTAKRAG